MKKELFYKMMSNYFAEEKVTADYSGMKEELEELAKVNKVVTLFCECAKYVNIEPSEEAKNITFQIVSRNVRNLTVQNKVLDMMDKNGISCVVLKGASVAINYPEAILRPFGDIDLLVSEADYEKAVDLFLGENERNQKSSGHEFHYQLKVDGISLEIHNAVAHYSTDELKAKEHMNNALKELKIKTMECFKFPALKEVFQAPALLLHTKSHYFDGELSFRLLSDWAMFVDKISDEMWNREIYPVLKNIGLSKWADSLNQICKNYLNLPFENKIHTFIEKDTVEKLAKEFICDISEDNEEKQQKNSLKNAIIWINDVAKRDFSLAQRIKFLAPLFWPVIVIRYLYRCRIGTREKIDFLGYANDYNAKEKLYRKIQDSK